VFKNGWVGHGAGLDGIENLATPGIDAQSLQPLTSLYTGYAFQAA
jgi:hypothetical protein